VFASYGEDSLDVTKVRALTSFDFIASNYKALVQRYALDLSQAFPEKKVVWYLWMTHQWLTSANQQLQKKAMKQQVKAIADPENNDPTLARLRPDT
jgi:thiamine kinase-like enzyme